MLDLPGQGNKAKRYEQGLGRMSTLLMEFDHSLRRAAPSAPGPAGRPGGQEETSPVRTGNVSGQGYFRRLKDYLQAFAGRSAEEGAATVPEDPGAVRIMTVHQAKGLELPVVFVPCLVEGRFPSAKMGMSRLWYVPDDLFDRARYEGREEDEARLLYVALTPARELLVVSRFRRHAKKAARPAREEDRVRVQRADHAGVVNAPSHLHLPQEALEESRRREEVRVHDLWDHGAAGTRRPVHRSHPPPSPAPLRSGRRPALFRSLPSLRNSFCPRPGAGVRFRPWVSNW